jgi:hypothetical protein
LTVQVSQHTTGFTDELPLSDEIKDPRCVTKCGAPRGEELDGPTSDSYWQRRSFEFSLSTEDNYAIEQFDGDNFDIRPLLDYTYHKRYNDDRILLQDRIIKDMCVGGSEQDNLLLPWVIFTAGAMGAGKGFTLEWMRKGDLLPLKQFVVVDPDKIRQTLPEWKGYVARDAEQAARRTQKEAGCMAEILGYRALRSRWNVIFDGSLRDVAWYKEYFSKLRSQFPGIRLMILHVKAERVDVLRRAAERAKLTGRVVPQQVLEDSLEAVPKSVAALAPHVDVALRVMNLDGQDPSLEREPGTVNPPEGIHATWDYVRGLWKPLDENGDGQLSKAEVLAALAHGVLTQAVLDTIDINHDGEIDRDEFLRAKEAAFQAASVRNSHCVQLQKQRSLKWSLKQHAPKSLQSFC